ncbi:hypothetical protein B2M20_02980 [Nitrobacter vulgaris]|uniref:Uncharacterized protein n=1 Tax=Nitrobacter vulgaris TaxID=29421 RepID=A0A1V4I362_NITVU|nr:hypothetical protein B2M20_02980 [Nitrobacter vulgaris]
MNNPVKAPIPKPQPKSWLNPVIMNLRPAITPMNKNAARNCQGQFLSRICISLEYPFMRGLSAIMWQR